MNTMCFILHFVNIDYYKTCYLLKYFYTDRPACTDTKISVYTQGDIFPITKAH